MRQTTTRQKQNGQRGKKPPESAAPEALLDRDEAAEEAQTAVLHTAAVHAQRRRLQEDAW